MHDAVALAHTTDAARGGTEIHAVCSGTQPEGEALLTALRRGLPAYMVPRTVHVIDPGFPSTATARLTVPP